MGWIPLATFVVAYLLVFACMLTVQRELTNVRLERSRLEASRAEAIRERAASDAASAQAAERWAEIIKAAAADRVAAEAVRMRVEAQHAIAAAELAGTIRLLVSWQDHRTAEFIAEIRGAVVMLSRVVTPPHRGVLSEQITKVSPRPEDQQ
jgi:hypothetical protein